MRKAMRLISAVLAVICIVLLVSCGDKNGSGKGQFSINDIKTAVFKSDFPEMVELGKSQLSNYYTIEDEWVSEFSVYVADSETVCDEVAIFRLANNSYANNVIAAIEQRLSTQISMLSSQNSVEEDKLNNCVFLQNDDIILMVVSQDWKDISSLLKKDYGFSEIVVK